MGNSQARQKGKTLIMALPQQEEQEFKVITDRQGAASLFKKMAAVMMELDSFNPDTRHQQGYMFVSAPQVHDQLRKLMGKHGLAFIPSIESAEMIPIEGKEGKTNYRYRITQTFSLCCADTGYMHTVPWSGECLLAGPNDDKAIHKAATLSQKHFLIRTFLGSVMDDPDADESPEEVDGRSSQNHVAQKGKQPDHTSEHGAEQAEDTEIPTIDMFLEAMKAHGFEKPDIKQALLDAGVNPPQWKPSEHANILDAVKKMVTANWEKELEKKIEADPEPEPAKAEEPKKDIPANGIDFGKHLKNGNGNGKTKAAVEEVVETEQSDDTLPFSAPADEIEVGVSYEDEDEEESSFEYK